MPRKAKIPTYITLSEPVARMLKVAAAREAMTASAFVAQLVLRECEKSGVADLIAGVTEEVRRGR